jgi:hypothetical protein
MKGENMIILKVILSTVQDVQEFCKYANQNEGDVLIYSGRYIVDGKSILGLYSLDLSKPIEVHVCDKITMNISYFDKFIKEL